MLDMAIGSPDASAVNFKVLKTLLRAMLNKYVHYSTSYTFL